MTKRTEDQIEEARNELFNSQGWKDFIVLMEQMRDTLQAALEDPNANGETLKFVQGRLVQIKHIVNWQRAIELTEEIEREAANADL